MEIVQRLGVRACLVLTRCRDEEGQVLVEYALIVAAIAVVSVSVVTTIGLHVSDIYSQVNIRFP